MYALYICTVLYAYTPLYKIVLCVIVGYGFEVSSG